MPLPIMLAPVHPLTLNPVPVTVAAIIPITAILILLIQIQNPLDRVLPIAQAHLEQTPPVRIAVLPVLTLVLTPIPAVILTHPTHPIHPIPIQPEKTVPATARLRKQLISVLLLSPHSTNLIYPIFVFDIL